MARLRLGRARLEQLAGVADGRLSGAVLLLLLVVLLVLLVVVLLLVLVDRIVLRLRLGVGVACLLLGLVFYHRTLED